MSSFINQKRPPTPDEWNTASGQEVSQLAHHLRRRKTRRQFLQASSAVGCIAVVTGGWWLLRPVPSASENKFGGLTCSEVAARANDYMQGRLSDVEADKMQQHLAQCPSCKSKFDEMS